MSSLVMITNNQDDNDLDDHQQASQDQLHDMNLPIFDREDDIPNDIDILIEEQQMLNENDLDADWNQHLIDENLHLLDKFPKYPPWNTNRNEWDQINSESFKQYQKQCSFFKPIRDYMNGDIIYEALEPFHKRLLTQGIFRISGRNELLTWRSNKQNIPQQAICPSILCRA